MIKYLVKSVASTVYFIPTLNINIARLQYISSSASPKVLFLTALVKLMYNYVPASIVSSKKQKSVQKCLIQV